MILEADGTRNGQVLDEEPKSISVLCFVELHEFPPLSIKFSYSRLLPSLHQARVLLQFVLCEAERQQGQRNHQKEKTEVKEKVDLAPTACHSHVQEDH